MSDPTSEIEDAVNDALRRRLPLRDRLPLWLRRLPATLARMGGYWGGVVMSYARRAVAFLRR